jgi:hypothetical protein
MEARGIRGIRVLIPLDQKLDMEDMEAASRSRDEEVHRAP